MVHIAERRRFYSCAALMMVAIALLTTLRCTVTYRRQGMAVSVETRQSRAGVSQSDRRISNNTIPFLETNETLSALVTKLEQLQCHNEEPIVVTVFDTTYAYLFANFVAMCSTNGLNRIVGLALSTKAANVARQDLLQSGLSTVIQEQVHILHDQGIQDYIDSIISNEKKRWFRVGHSKLLITLALLLKECVTFVIEVDVLLLKPPLPLLPTSSESYDVASMYCPTATAKNRINLGFQLWHPTKASLAFFEKIVTKAIERGLWDQGVMSRMYVNKTEHSIRLARLPICVPHPAWSNENGVPPLVKSVFYHGDVRKAVEIDNHTAIHIIGHHGLSKAEWMRSGQFLDAEPLNASRFVMLDGVFSTELYRDAVAAVFVAGQLLGRTPVLPHLNVSDSRQPHDLVDVEKLRSCPGGFRTPPFLYGQYYLNRSFIPQNYAFCNIDSFISEDTDLLVLSMDKEGSACESMPLGEMERANLATGRHIRLDGRAEWSSAALLSVVNRLPKSVRSTLQTCTAGIITTK